MKNLLGLGLLLSLLLNVFLLLQRHRETPPPPAPVVRTEVLEKTIEREVPVVVPLPAPVAESRPAAPVAPLQVMLVATPTTVEPAGEIKVLCTIVSGALQARHWIGMVAPGAAVSKYSQYRMISEGSFSYVFKAPKESGDVEFRYMLGDDQTVIAVSNVVRVYGTPPARPLVHLQAGSTVVRSGGEVQVQWSVYSGKRTLQDWIGLYPQGARDEAFAVWKYITDNDQGVLTLQAPEEPGTYEFRYFPDNGYESAAVSVRITVVP